MMHLDSFYLLAITGVYIWRSRPIVFWCNFRGYCKGIWCSTGALFYFFGNILKWHNWEWTENFFPFAFCQLAKKITLALKLQQAPDEEFEEYLRHLIGEHCTGDRNEVISILTWMFGFGSVVINRCFLFRWLSCLRGSLNYYITKSCQSHWYG